MIDCASTYTGRGDTGWLSDCVRLWRLYAVVSDVGLPFDDALSQDQVQIILRLADEACGALEARESISAHEMEAWDLLDGEGVFARGASQFPTAMVVELGRS